MELHHQAVKEYGDIMNWDEIFVEGYCILNPECKAAKLTKANTDLRYGRCGCICDDGRKNVQFADFLS